MYILPMVGIWPYCTQVLLPDFLFSLTQIISFFHPVFRPCLYVLSALYSHNSNETNHPV